MRVLSAHCHSILAHDDLASALSPTMCLVVANDQNHIANQCVAAFLFGAIVGYCDHIGMFQLARTLTLMLLVLTILDHLTVILVPWGYHGPGFEPGRFQGRAMTMEQLVVEILGFFINNLCLYFGFIFWYGLFSGRTYIYISSR